MRTYLYKILVDNIKFGKLFLHSIAHTHSFWNILHIQFRTKIVGKTVERRLFNKLERLMLCQNGSYTVQLVDIPDQHQQLAPVNTLSTLILSQAEAVLV